MPSTRNVDSAWSSQTAHVVTCALLDVRSRLVQQLQDVVVVYGVVCLPAFPSNAHEPHRPEQPELMRNRGFADARQALARSSDAQLSRPERIEDANAGRIAEHPERLGHGVHVLRDA